MLIGTPTETPVVENVATPPAVETPVENTLVNNPTDEVIKNPEWMSAMPEAYKNDPNLAKYKDIDSFLEGHMSLSRKIGEKFEMPSDESEDSTWNKWYEKTGRPQTPTEYNYELGEDTTITKEDLVGTKEAMHALGLSQKQFTGLMDLYDKNSIEQRNSSIQSELEATENKQVETVKTLSKEWGNDYETNLKISNQTLTKFGIADRIVELGLGDDVAAVKLGYELAKQIGETSLNNEQPISTNFAESVAVLKKTEAFKNTFHPEHKQMMEKIRQMYEKQYGN